MYWPCHTLPCSHLLLAHLPCCAVLPPLLQVTSATPSFEEVALRLMETGEPEAVAAFLQTRLDTLGREDKAQVGVSVCIHTHMAGSGDVARHVSVCPPSASRTT